MAHCPPCAINQKNSHITALGARPRMDSGGFWDEGRIARLLDTAAYDNAVFLMAIQASKHICNILFFSYNPNCHKSKWSGVET